MPQEDIVHDAVKGALIKDGWSIVADPYTITYRRSQLYADLCAERQETENVKRVIVVEIKSFRGASAFMTSMPHWANTSPIAICLRKSGSRFRSI